MLINYQKIYSVSHNLSALYILNPVSKVIVRKKGLNKYISLTYVKFMNNHEPKTSQHLLSEA